MSAPASAQGLGGDFAAQIFEQLQQQGLGRSIEIPPGLSESMLDKVRRLERERLKKRTGEAEDERGGARRQEAVSLLERDYGGRIGRPVAQFGYDIFWPGDQFEQPLIGAIQNDYLLGIGDEFIVTFYGQSSNIVRVRVDREGRVILPNMPPMYAAGRTYGDFVREIEAATRTSLLGTEVFVSLGTVRAVTVMVLGEVDRPGAHQLTGLSTALDALVAAGGIKKTGSLRRIRVIRGDRTFWIDAYDLLFTGQFDRDVRIFDGDRIVVPTIGATIAVAGKVKRPAIYELSERQDSVSLDVALGFAGGTLRPKGSRFLQVAIAADGSERVTERDASTGAEISDGDILFVTYRGNILQDSVVLDGHVRLRQRRSIASAPTVRDLIGDGSLFEEGPYLPFAVVLTIDPLTFAAKFVPVNLEQVMAGRENYSFRSRDTLIVLSAGDVRFLASSDVQSILSGERPDTVGVTATGEKQEIGRVAILTETRRDAGRNSKRLANRQIDVAGAGGEELRKMAQAIPGFVEPAGENGNGDDDRAERDRDEELDRLELVSGIEACAGLRALVAIAANTRAGRYASAIRSIAGDREGGFRNRMPCPDIFDRYPDLLPFTLDYVVSLNGEVRVPGAYPILPATTLASAVAVAGGLTREVDLTSIELTRFTVQSLQGTSQVERGFLNLASTGFDSVLLNPGDSVRFNPVFTERDAGPVLLTGEFVRPGFYEIRRGERLSELITRAGGVTPQAYPYGAVFTRESVKRSEAAANQRAANELENALITAITSSGTTGARSAAAAVVVRELADDLREMTAVGRVVMESDLAVLEVRPELDTVLEPGDRLIMPKRPNSVAVIGEVLNPGNLQFLSAMKADDYVRMAGGFRRSADESRVFVVLPNGTARPISVSPWNYTPVNIPPGSSIVVPRDPTPFDFLTVLQIATDVLSKLAVSAAALAVISNN